MSTSIPTSKDSPVTSTAIPIKSTTGSSATGASTTSASTTSASTTASRTTGSSTTASSTTVGSNGHHIPSTTQHSTAGFEVPRILSWKNPYETGVLLAETLGLFIVFSSPFTLRYFFKLASSVLGLLSVVELGSRAISGQRQGLVSNYKPSRFLPLSDSAVHEVANYVSFTLRRVVFGAEHLIDSREPTKGLKLSVTLYVAYVLLGLFPLKSLVFTSIVIAFGLPPLYLQFKPEIDSALGQAHHHAHEHLKQVHDKIHAKAGPQLNYAKKFLGPRGGFPGTAKVDPIKDVPTAGAKPTKYTSGSKTSATNGHSTEATAPSSSTLNGTSTNGASATKGVNEDLFKNFDSVPTLHGNVPIDHEKLQAALSADKAKAEGAVNF